MLRTFFESEELGLVREILEYERSRSGDDDGEKSLDDEDPSPACKK